MDVKYIIVIGIGVTLLLFASFLVSILFSQQKKLKYQRNMQQLREEQQNQLIEAAVISEETERHRIAETLHDEVGAILSSAKLHLLGIKGNNLDERDRNLHTKGGELLNDVIQRVRGISHNLHSNILQEFGLNEAIRHFLQKVTQGSAISATTSLDDNYQTVEASNDIIVYRMLQELLNNTLKYANATSITIRSTLLDQTLELQIAHNGEGLTQAAFEELRFKKDGLGLKNIQNRIILLKGHILFARTDDQYTVTITMPVKTQNEPDQNRHS